MIGVVGVEGDPLITESEVAIELQEAKMIPPVSLPFDNVIVASPIQLPVANVQGSSSSITNIATASKVGASRKRRRFATQRLDETNMATKTMSMQMAEKLAMKKKFYDSYIELYRREVEAKEKYYKRKLEILNS